MSNKEPGYVCKLARSTFGRFDTSKNPCFREDWK
jgi:hypothetical protein